MVETAVLVVGSIVLVLGGVGAFAQFFLFGRLARFFSMKIDACEFAAIDRKIVLVAATCVNKSKASTRIFAISFRAIVPGDWSEEARAIDGRIERWVPLTAGHSRMRPGESLQVVFELPWPKSRVSLPLQFLIEYEQSRAMANVLEAIWRILLRRGGERREVLLYGLATHPFIGSMRKEKGLHGSQGNI